MSAVLRFKGQPERKIIFEWVGTVRVKDVNSHNSREEHVVKEELCSVHEVVVHANLLHRDENLLHSKSRLSLAYAGSFRIACCQKRQQWLEFRLFIYVYLSLNPPPQTSQHIWPQRFVVITWHLLLAKFHVWHGLTFNIGARGWRKRWLQNCA